jgi:phytoene synthase
MSAFPEVATKPASVVSPLQLRAAYSVCRHVTRSAATNFYYAFLVLPRRKRDALSAVYAFMRHADDISDHPAMPAEEKRTRLEAWSDGLHRVLAHEPTDDPVLIAVADTQRRYHIPTELLDKLVQGTGMDVAPQGASAQATPAQAAGPQVFYRTFEELYRYCYYVASVVGLVCIRIFGYDDAAAEPLAERCGVAFQLTNIIRDLKEDLDLGRVYLPQEDLAQVGLAPADLALAEPSRWRPALERLAQRAHEFYGSAERLLPLIDEDSRPALWVLVEIYRRILQKIAARNYDVFSERIRLTKREKLAVLGKGLLLRITT